MSEFIKLDNQHSDESQPPYSHIAYPAHINPLDEKPDEYALEEQAYAANDLYFGVEEHLKHLKESGFSSNYIAWAKSLYQNETKDIIKPHYHENSLQHAMGEKALSSLMSQYIHPEPASEYIEPPLANWEMELLGEVKHTKSHSSISDMMFNTIQEWAPSSSQTIASMKGRRRDPRIEQDEAEASYDIAIEPLEPEAELTPDELIERMEVDHAVKVPPRFKDQVKDKSRKNRISYKRPVRDRYGRILREERVSMTEHQMLVGLNKFLDTAIEYGKLLSADYNTSKKAQRIQENLTFIGRKEYKEAIGGIATYWRALLDHNPDQQILVLAGEIAKRYESGGGRVKSDEYLLDNILAQFSDEDAEKYSGRLITDISDITVTDAKDLKIVLLDDWTISGSQLSIVAESLMDQFPKFKKSIEVQLVTANRDRVTRGLEVRDPEVYFDEYSKIKIPVRTYYQAHESPKSTHGAHISGFHSSVDYDFENSINSIIYEIGYGQKRPRSLRDLPPLTNIVRPYRTKRYKLTQKDRFRRR